MTEAVIDVSEEILNAELEPDDVASEVMQNVRTLLSTFKGTVPLDRKFGISGDVMDLPPGRAMAKLQIEILEAIQDYEPRAEVAEIGFGTSAAADGVLYPKVKIRIGGQA